MRSLSTQSKTGPLFHTLWIDHLLSSRDKEHQGSILCFLLRRKPRGTRNHPSSSNHSESYPVVSGRRHWTCSIQDVLTSKWLAFVESTFLQLPITPSCSFRTGSGCHTWHKMLEDLFRDVRTVPCKKIPRQLPSSILLPLPILCYPWLHMGMDFIWSLPPFDWFICVLVTVDVFPSGNQPPWI